MRPLRRLIPVTLAALAVMAATPASAAPVNPLAPTLVANPQGVSPRGAVSDVDMSRDGRVTAFLVEESSGHSVWLRDAAGTLIRADRGPSQRALAAASNVSISGDSRLVLFTSTSPDLVAGFDPKGVPQLFRYYRHEGWIDAPLRSTTGGPLNSAVVDLASSYDGTHVAFTSRASNLGVGNLSSTQVFLFSRLYTTPSKVKMISTGANNLPGNADATYPSIGREAAGLVVSYTSRASNLVASDRNGLADVFTWSEGTSSSTLVSAHAGIGGSVTADTMSTSREHAISGDGRWIAFTTGAPLSATDKNETDDVYVYDRTNRTYQRASVAKGGVESQMGGADASISSDGMRVAFNGAEDLFPGKRDAYVSNMAVKHFDTGSLARGARTSQGGPLNIGGEGYNVDSYALSADGRTAVFATDAPLAAGDTDNVSDAYLTTSATGTVWIPETAINLKAGTTVTLQVQGAGFTGSVGAVVGNPPNFSLPVSGSDVSVQSVTFVSSTALAVTFLVPADAVPGKYGLSVLRADSVAGGCTACITVTN